MKKKKKKQTNQGMEKTSVLRISHFLIVYETYNNKRTPGAKELQSRRFIELRKRYRKNKLYVKLSS